MDYFDISNPTANQILVWSDIDQAFINVDPITPSSGVMNGMNISNQGSTIFQDVVNGSMRFRSLVAGDGVTLNDYNTYVEIHFDGNADSLSGFSHMDFLKVSNNLSEINPITARDNLDVYSVSESHNQFMETNASNIPDTDNAYDLGSNGRRYADIYAKTFHGTATHSSTSEQLSRNNAMDGQVLTWDNGVDRWMPSTPKPITITGAEDLFTEGLEDRSILRYNANRNRWEPEIFELGDTDGGSIADIENIGNGFSIYRNRTGFVANMRTIRGGDSVSLRYNFNDDEIVIDANVPANTDDLPEGTVNRYYTDARFDNRLSISNVRQLNDVQSGTPSINQGLLWNGSEFRFRNIAVDIYSSNDIPEGNANLYYTETRVRDVINGYLSSPGITLNQISDVSSSHANKNILISNGISWQSRRLVMDDISNVNVSGISNSDVLVWNSAASRFDTSTLPQRLIDLSETTSSEHFNTSSFLTKLAAINSDTISEGITNRYLTNSNLINELATISINELNDVDMIGISNNDVLVWDATEGEFTPKSIDTITGGGVSSIFELDEIDNDIIDMLDGDVLEWDSTSSSFKRSIRYDEISKLVDVSFTNLNQGETLVYNGSAFTNEMALPFQLTNVANNQILSWDGDKFVNTGLGDIGDLNLSVSDLSDVAVNFSDLNTGDSLVWDNMVNAFVSGPSAQFINIKDINGMDIDGIEVDNTIRWDGFNFVKANLPYFNPTQFNDNDVLVFDQTQGVFISKDKWEHLDINYDTSDDKSILIFNQSTNSFDMRPVFFDDVIDIDNTVSSEDGTDYVLKWNDATQKYIVHAPRLIVDVLNDVDDVNITDVNNGDILCWNDTDFVNISHTINNVNDVNISDISNGDILYWNDTDFVNISHTINNINDVDITDIANGDMLIWENGAFKNSPFTFSLRDLDDVDDSDLENYYSLVWDDNIQKFITASIPTTIRGLSDVFYDVDSDNQLLIWNGSVFVGGTTLSKMQKLSYEYLEWFPTTEEEDDDGNLIINTPGFEYDEFETNRTVHYREVTENTVFKIVDIPSTTNELNILHIHLSNPGNYDIQFVAEYQEEDGNGDTVTVTNPVTIGNQIHTSGNNVNLYATSFSTGSWTIYETHNQIGNRLPSFSTDTINDNEIFIYDGSEDTMVSRLINTQDISDMPNTKADNDLLVWNTSSNAYISTKSLTSTVQDKTYYSNAEVLSTSIDPLASLYQQIISTSNTDYVINDITMNSNTAYKTILILDNADNYTITFDTETTGTIEYVELVPPNYNGKHKIEILTFDGINWIFEVKAIV